jgi:hypothetical protein
VSGNTRDDTSPVKGRLSERFDSFESFFKRARRSLLSVSVAWQAPPLHYVYGITVLLTPGLQAYTSKKWSRTLSNGLEQSLRSELCKASWYQWKEGIMQQAGNRLGRCKKCLYLQHSTGIHDDENECAQAWISHGISTDCSENI